MDEKDDIEKMKIQQIMMIVIGEEKRNLRTDKFSFSKMVEKHIETIKEIVKC